MMRIIHTTLAIRPYPWPRTRDKRRNDPRYVAWMTSFGWLLRAALPGPWPMTGRFGVGLVFHRARANSDVDNLAKAVLDAMTRAGMWRDDHLVDALLAVRGAGGTPGIDIVLAVGSSADVRRLGWVDRMDGLTG